jgi:hypothetical protein
MTTLKICYFGKFSEASNVKDDVDIDFKCLNLHPWNQLQFLLNINEPMQFEK